MSQAANFTIKDGASTPADVLFTNVQPAGGSLPATYYARSRGPMTASQPVIRTSSKGMQGKREVLHTVSVPYAVTGTDGVTKVVGSAFAEVRVVLPDTVPDTVRADLRAFVANSCNSPQFVESMTTGYAPN